MKINRHLLLLLPVVFSLPLYAQVLSTPGGTVSDNGTTDHVLVNGHTKLINPNGRTLTIERDDEDSWLMFHDPNNYWYSMGIDRSNNGAFTLNSGGVLGAPYQFVMTSAGNVGIGLASPETRLHLANGGQVVKFLSGSNTSSYVLDVGVNDDGINFSNNSYIRGFNFGNASGKLFTIAHNGNVGIGTDAASLPDAKLAVRGHIHAQEVRVDLDGSVAPDYVFAPDYRLLSLRELEAYVKVNNHLPEVPSATQMEEEGLNLKAMNLILLKKIEELTLHLIAQNKSIEVLQQEVERLKDK